MSFRAPGAYLVEAYFLVSSVHCVCKGCLAFVMKEIKLMVLGLRIREEENSFAKEVGS